MRFFKIPKDGGPLSKVWGLFVIEWKSLFSIVVLRFDDGARDAAYHAHAFNAVSWVLKGTLGEETVSSLGVRPVTSWKTYRPSWRPIYTPRDCFHKVHSIGTTWAITFRGPWVGKWKEYLPNENKIITLTRKQNHLTHDRMVVVDENPD